ncbi:MAG: ABC transporter ATP-binding protein, partial [Streblomastix strix]
MIASDEKDYQAQFVQDKHTTDKFDRKTIIKPNLEENSPFIMNMFYCFFMPFVCRLKPITNEDMYEVADSDRSVLTTKQMSEGWMYKYNQYVQEKIEYEQLKADYPGVELKSPKSPSLFQVMIHCGSWRLLTSIIILIFSVGFQICQPSLMKEVIKAVITKGMAAEMNPTLPPEYQIESKFPYVSAIILMLCPFLNGLLDTLGSRFIFHFSSQLRSGLAGLIYQKTLLLNITSQSNIDTGRLLSLLSTDTSSIAMMFPMFFNMILLPIQIFVPFGFVAYDWGLSSLMSFGVFLFSFPFQAMVVPVLIKALKGYLTHNDTRNKVINEILQGMRVVKLSGLENEFIKRVESTRETQLNDVFYWTLTVQLFLTIMNATPQAVNVATMSVYITSQDVPQQMFPVSIMPTIGQLTMMTMPLMTLTVYVYAGSMVLISVSRIREFLILPELKVEPQIAPSNKKIAVEIRSCTFIWGDPPEIPLEQREKNIIMEEAEQRRKCAKIEEEKKKILEKQQEMMKMKRQSSYNEDIDGQYKLQQIEQNMGIQMQELLQNGVLSKRSLNCNPDTEIEQQQYQQPSLLEPPTNITPPLSLNQSYSSSLSQSLNQSQIINGKQMKYPTLYDITFRLPKGSLTMVVGSVGSGKSSIGAALIGDIEKQSGIIRIDGSIAYCPQTAWINNNTIRGNITFGSEFNQRRYNEVVRICALEPDFNTLAAGDMTAIGEKGVNLSGGQKARIQLARAVYSDRDIYILDDPLSAVDAHVGRFLLEECIDGKLKGKTRLLMTNQLQYIDKADNVIILNKGRIIAQGTSAQLKEKGINFDEFIIK